LQVLVEHSALVAQMVSTQQTLMVLRVMNSAPRNFLSSAAVSNVATLMLPASSFIFLSISASSGVSWIAALAGVAFRE
jgi:hypothetical protein